MHDANFNVTGLVDTSGTVVERYVYDPFGSVTILEASWGTLSGSGYAWQYHHQGGRLDRASGLYHFRNRDYSPTLGRWNKNDPIRFQAGDPNLFRALGSNPISRVDILGLRWVDTGRYQRAEVAPNGSPYSIVRGHMRDGRWVRPFERHINGGRYQDWHVVGSPPPNMPGYRWVRSWTGIELVRREVSRGEPRVYWKQQRWLPEPPNAPPLPVLVPVPDPQTRPVFDFGSDGRDDAIATGLVVVGTAVVVTGIILSAPVSVPAAGAAVILVGLGSIWSDGPA